MVRRPIFTGLPAWAVQRVSAVYMLVYLLGALANFAIHPRTTYEDWSGWMRGPFVSVISILFFLALFSHMWVGLRDVVLDYAKPDWLCRGVLAALSAVLLGLTVWVVFILFA